MNDELEQFLKKYEIAANSCNFDNVEPLLTNDAVFWFTNGTYEGKAAIRKAFEDTWASIKEEKYTLSNIQWLGVTGDLAVCVYDFTSDGMVDGVRQVYHGRGTSVFTKQEGKWLICHEHLSKAV